MNPRTRKFGAWLLRFPISLFNTRTLSPEERGIAKALRCSLERVPSTTTPKPVALDAGAGSQRHRRAIEQLGYSYRSLEIDKPFSPESPAPDFVGSMEKIPCKDAAFDAVFSLQVLEHVRYPQAAIQEVARVLRPNGSLLLTTNFMYPRHGSPHDFFRFTPNGLESLCRDAGLRVIRISGIGGLFAVFQYAVSAELDALGRFAVFGRAGWGDKGPLGTGVNFGLATIFRLTLLLPALWLLNSFFLLLVFPLQLLDFVAGRAGGLSTVGYALLAIKD